MSVKLLTDQHLEFLSLKGGYTLLEITCYPSCLREALKIQMLKLMGKKIFTILH